MGYVHTNAKGTYYLNSKEVQLNPKVKTTVMYFSKDVRPEHCDLPTDREVVENANNGFPVIRKKK